MVQRVIKLHGIPQSIVSERDPIFLSELWIEIARLQGTELCLSSTYHPQTDGQTEALNHCLKMHLHFMTGDEPGKWEGYLAWAEYWYNTTFQTSTGMTLFRALYGRDPPTIVSYEEGGSLNTQVDKALQDWDDLLRELKKNMSQAQLRMKNQADKKRRELEFAAGDWVFVRLQPYRQLSLRLHKYQKLSPRFFGPYKVIQRVGNVAYKLELLASTRIHPVFHISQLKLCKEQPLQQITPLPLFREADSIDETSAMSNPEDKVRSLEGGIVENTMETTTQETSSSQAIGDAQATSSSQNAEKVEKILELRRGTRERKAPLNTVNKC
ncbi:Transposon Ty3-G Gag-Pol polyprotein [Gossypium australe]|uniref:Transposon Ty3-G Gag-Pol polyprotein n=1 Tax=Gossypium australe TaxID=47621 RepID=A0A5B6UQ09_9ROSI|nr:Transposon Ty3-G Gag-Pol polyprotein [Gossypium australe]